MYILMKNLKSRETKTAVSDEALAICEKQLRYHCRIVREGSSVTRSMMVLGEYTFPLQVTQRIETYGEVPISPLK